MHKSFKLASVTFAAAALMATSACAAGSYAAPGSPSAGASAKATASAKPSAAPASKSATAKAGTPSQILRSTAWETTGAKNEKGEKVALTDAAVKNYVGYAYYEGDGTFAMYTLADKPKMKGDWAVSPDGKTRTLSVKGEDGKVTKRTVEIVKLTEKDFTYRVYPEASDKSKYFDIIHTPTKHAEPRA